MNLINQLITFIIIGAAVLLFLLVDLHFYRQTPLKFIRRNRIYSYMPGVGIRIYLKYKRSWKA